MRTLGGLALAALAAAWSGGRSPDQALGDAGVAATARTRVLAWGDQGDGTFRNPVLKADYPDVVRVGEDFYLVASRDGHVDVDDVRYDYSDQPGSETVAW